MRKNKNSGGGPGPSKMLKRIKGIFKRKEDEDLNDMRGDSDEDNDEHPEMNGIPRKLRIIPVSEYQIPSDFRPYRDYKDYWVNYEMQNPLIRHGKCYEYVYVDRVGEDEKTAWATMRPNYAGKFHYVKTIERRGIRMTLFWFDVEENGIEYTNLVEAPDDPYYTRRYGIKAMWVREVLCDSIEPGKIPSLQLLAYNKVSKEVKDHLHDKLDFQVPKKGGNSVKRNKRSGRKTIRKSKRSTRRKSRRNKL
jgi:hypothetical protein